MKLKFDKQKRTWIILPKYSKEGIYLDGKLKLKLDNVKKILSKKYDCLILISGGERVGKSTLGHAVSYYLTDSHLSLDNYAIDTEDAIKKIEKLERTVLIIDEGMLVFSSKDHMNRKQRQLLQILTICGQKQIILVVIAPSVLDLNKYIVCRRARFLLRAYSDERFNRGNFAYYGTDKLKVIYELGKKYGIFPQRVYPNFRGRFNDFKPEFNTGYLKLKLDTLEKSFKNKPKELSKEERRVFDLEVAKKNKELEKPITNIQLSRLLGVHRHTISQYYKELLPTKSPEKP